MLIINKTLVSVNPSDVNKGRLVVPKEVEKIGRGGIDGEKIGTAVNETTLPEGLKEIAAEGISNCGVSVLSIPRSVEAMNPASLGKLPQLERLEVKNPNLMVRGSWLSKCRELREVRIGAVEYKVAWKQGTLWNVIKEEERGGVWITLAQRFRTPEAPVVFARAGEKECCAENSEIACKMAKRLLEAEAAEGYPQLQQNSEIDGIDIRLILGESNGKITRALASAGIEDDKKIKLSDATVKMWGDGEGYGAKLMEKALEKYKERRGAGGGMVIR